jgi:cytosine/adenosine deaminase-related metal-dependent hydrolase
VRGIFPDDVVGQSRLAQVFRLQAAMTEEEEYATSLLAIVELLRSGTTTMLDPGTTKSVDACLQAYDESGCRIVTGTAVTDLPDPKLLPRFSPDEAVSLSREFVRRFDGRLGGRVRAWVMPFSTDTCSPDLLMRLRGLADELGVGLAVHHSSGPELRERFNAYGGFTQYLESLGFLGPNVLLAHLIGLDRAEADVLARTGASVAFCPSATLKESRGVIDSWVPELLRLGVRVAVGADSANNSNYLDSIRQLNALAVEFKDARRDVSLIPAEQALELGTRIGAEALGLGDVSGSIEVGKQADLVMFDSRRAEWSALFDPVNNLNYGADAGSVETVIVDGRIVVDGFKATFVDEAALSDEVQGIGERLLARTGARWSAGRWPVK